MKLDKKLYHYFEEKGLTTFYHEKEIIYLQEEDAHSIYLIKAGRVRVFSLSPDGKEIMYDLLEPGQFFGESSMIHNGSRSVSVETVEDVTLVSCRIEDLYVAITESPALMQAIMTLLIAQTEYLMRIVRKERMYDRYEKVAAFLVERETLHPHQPITFTHEEMGIMVGLNRVSVSRVMKEFAQKGYIQQRYKHIEVINVKAMKTIIERKEGDYS